MTEEYEETIRQETKSRQYSFRGKRTGKGEVWFNNAYVKKIDEGNGDN